MLAPSKLTQNIPSQGNYLFKEYYSRTLLLIYFYYCYYYYYYYYYYFIIVIKTIPAPSNLTQNVPSHGHLCLKKIISIDVKKSN